MLKDLPSPIPLAKVDGIIEKELSEKYGAKGWPTLMIFRNGQKFSYEGPRDEPGKAKLSSVNQFYMLINIYCTIV